MDADSDRYSQDDSEAVLDPLGNELARRILVAGCRGVVTAGSLADELDVSKTTVYRHLNRLEEAGLIAEVTDVRESPSSKAGYRTDVRALYVRVSDDGITATSATASELEAVLAVLLEHVDVEETTVDFEDGTMSVRIRADDEVLEQLRDAYLAARNGT